jgi:hypothetical protein
MGKAAVKRSSTGRDREDTSGGGAVLLGLGWSGGETNGRNEENRKDKRKYLKKRNKEFGCQSICFWFSK